MRSSLNDCWKPIPIYEVAIFFFSLKADDVSIAFDNMIVDFAKVYPSVVCQIEMFYPVWIKQMTHILEVGNNPANR